MFFRLPKQTLLIPLFIAALALSACAPGIARFGGQGKPSDVDVAALVKTPAQESGRAIYCRVGKGEARFSRGWYEFPETGFIVRQGGRTRADLRSPSGELASLVSMVGDDEQKMIFCPLRTDPPGARVSCTSIYALEEDLNEGIKRTFDVPEAVRGAAISCATSPYRLRSLATPAAGGN